MRLCAHVNTASPGEVKTGFIFRATGLYVVVILRWEIVFFALEKFAFPVAVLTRSIPVSGHQAIFVFFTGEMCIGDQRSGCTQ
jgi:hypothetical protein